MYRAGVRLDVLRCPNCHAPVDGVPGGQAQCRFCGVTLVAAPPAPANTETRFSLVLRVGPSNIERVVALLGERLSMPPADVRALLANPRCEIELGTDESQALALTRDVVHAGGHAELARRTVEIPRVRVLLEDAGADRIAAVFALRQHLDFTIEEARRLAASAPVVVVEAMDEPLAHALVTALQKAGARAGYSRI